ncbi:MAG: FHA domain-containing protein [bacterium]
MSDIIIRVKDKEVRRLNIDKKVITIGRSRQSDIFLDNQAISRHHAEILITNDNEVILSDLESKNGTYINSERIKKRSLKNGDIIRVGKFELIYNDSIQKINNITKYDFNNTVIVDQSIIEKGNQDSVNQKLDLESDNSKNSNIVNDSIVPALKGIKCFGCAEVEITKKQFYLGKSCSADLQVKGFFISPLQTSIIYSPEGYYIQDVGQYCRTRVNGKKIIKILLKSNDLIQIGKTKFQFILPDEKRRS